jgi:hypothetical protein
MACDVYHTYQPALDALTRLGQINPKTGG